MRARDRLLVWGAGGMAAVLFGCYGWHPLASCVAALVTSLIVAAILDDAGRGRQ